MFIHFNNFNHASYKSNGQFPPLLFFFPCKIIDKNVAHLVAEKQQNTMFSRLAKEIVS